MVCETLLPLLLFAAAATFTPGGATTLATTSGAHFGFRRSLPLLAGIAFGLASMAAAAAAGLAGALLALPALQLGMKALGSLYLVWLAWNIGRAGSPRLQAASARPASFLGGVWMLWHNPKAWAMTIGAAASFAAVAGQAQELALTLALALGLAFGVAALLSLSLWCLAGQLLASLLRTERQWRILNGALALLLVISIVPMWRN